MPNYAEYDDADDHVGDDDVDMGVAQVKCATFGTSGT